MQSSRIEAIKQAIHDYKEKFPQFLNPNYQPTPEQAEEHKKYLTLKRDLDRANSLTAFKQFQAKVNDDTPVTDQAVELMLALTGLRFVPEPLKFNETRVGGEKANAQSEPLGNERTKALETQAGLPATFKLTDREKAIWNVIQRKSKGLQYCRELDGAGIRIRRTGVWKGAPPNYAAAYQEGEPWRHRIQDKKCKISRKAKLAKLAKPLAGE